MTRQVSSFSRAPWALGIISGVLGLGLLVAGLYLAPELATLGLALLGLGLPIVLLLWRRPEFGLLALIFLTSGIVTPSTFDVRLPIGGGLDLRDLTLLGMLALVGFRELVRKTMSIPWWPVGGLLFVFLGFVALSAGYAVFYQGVEITWVLSELRDLTFYAVFFLAAWTLKEQRQLTIVVMGLFLIADITAAVLVLQQFLGGQTPLLASMTTGWQINEQFSSAFGGVRVIPPGNSLMFFMMSIALCMAVFTKGNGRLRIFALLQFVFLILALLLTYTRAQWAATIIVLGLVSVAFVSMHRRQLAWYFTVGTAALLLAVFVGGMYAAEFEQTVERVPLIKGVVDRTLSTFEFSDTTQVSSLEWRGFETEEAWHSLSQRPLLGVGLGNAYRNITLLRGEASGYKGSLAKGTYSRFTRYVHSSYVFMAVKMGLPALIFFLAFCAVFLLKSWRLFGALADGQPKNIVLAVMAGFVGLLVWATVHHELATTSGVAVVGLVVGLVAGIDSVHMHPSRHRAAYVERR